MVLYEAVTGRLVTRERYSDTAREGQIEGGEKVNQTVRTDTDVIDDRSRPQIIEELKDDKSKNEQ